MASPTVTAAVFTASTSVRGEIYELLLGSSATPADNAITWKVQRFTGAGSTSAYTPNPLDPADPVSLCSAGVTATIEPTYTSGKLLFHIALNQRATHRWIADPRGPLKIPATGSNGAGIYPVHASFTGNTDGTFYFSE